MIQEVTRQRAGIKTGTAAARAAFIYGEGDGVRVTDRKRLAQIGGVSLGTINNNVAEWETEFLHLVAGKSETGMRLVLSSEDVATHKRNVQHFKELDQQLQQEILDLPKIEKYLRGLIDWFKDNGTSGDVADMRDLVNSFLRTTAARKSLIKQRLDVNARWNKLTGIEDLIDAAGAREKAMQTGRAKIDLELERKEAGLTGDGGPVKPVPPMGRRYVKKDAVPVEVVKEDDGFGDDE